MARLSRREFLKLAAGAPAALAFSQTLVPSPPGTNSPNIIVLVFDAMSADNLSLYGYPRKTSPNFERLAQRSTVYHSHYSAGSFTTSGTASLLTGLYPWTHRAISINGQVAPAFADKNIFALMGNSYDRAGFGQNFLAELLLSEFRSNLDIHLPPDSFSVRGQVFGASFKDTPASYYALDDFLFRLSDSPRSPLLGLIERALFGFRLQSISTTGYVDSLPHTDYKIYYRLQDIFSGLISELNEFRRPFLAYFHLWSPHAPYSPRVEFMDLVRAGLNSPRKPEHPLGDRISYPTIQAQRRLYDAYVANVDWEFGRFLDNLESSGELDRSYLIVTSDHGEMFERGVFGHDNPLMYDSILHIPLLISAPGQNSRGDIISQTNSVDILPTLLHIAGFDIPAWAEGQLLPGFGGVGDNSRATYSVDAKIGSSFGRLSVASLAMRKNGYKLIYYKGYTGTDWFELYNLQEDAEELDDLYNKDVSASNSMRDEMLTAFNQHSGPLKG
ncbi:MAG TPA: sulfatase-like hydrolase/transferase [Anaerolineales bacterium]|nr:sulfatase-like hydrolase/transferase [Anaerolineales bacterium]